MRKFYSLKVFFTMCFLCMVSVLSAVAQTTVTDELTTTSLGVATTSYVDRKSDVFKSGAQYESYACKQGSDVQINKKNNYGIVTLKSGGVAKSIKVTLTSTNDLNVYGSNTAYTATSDLHDTAKQGTLLGTINSTTTIDLTDKGNYSFIGFVSKKGVIKITSIEIVWQSVAGSVSVPTISAPASAFVSGTSFLNPFSVTLTAESGANIYYTTDGTDPTTSSKKYTAPITISETTTLKAIAEKDGKTSSVAQAVYTKLDIIDGFAELKEKATAGNKYYLNFVDAIVTCAEGNYALMEDATAGIAVYLKGHGFKVGQKISGTAEVTFNVSYGLNEITSVDKSNLTIEDGVTIPVTDLTLSQLLSAMDTYESMRVRIQGLNITSDFSSSSKQCDAEQNGQTIVLYQRLKDTGSFPTLLTDAKVDVVGYPTIYKTSSRSVNELTIWHSSDVLTNDGTIDNPLTPEEACNFGDLFANKSVWVKGTVSSVDESNVVVGESGALSCVTVGNVWTSHISEDSELSFYGKLKVNNSVATMSVPSRVKGTDAKMTIGTAEGYGTYVSDAEFEVPEGVQCGVVKGAKDGKLDIDYIYESGAFVPENVPVLVKANQAGSYDLTLGFAEADDAPTSNYLKAGNGEAIAADADHYYYKLAYDDYDNKTDLGFYWGAADGGAFIVPVGKAYLALPKTGSQVMGYSFKNGEMTGIHNAAAVEGAAKKVYTLDGRKADAENLGKGIYVVNGKKVIVK